MLLTPVENSQSHSEIATKNISDREIGTAAVVVVQTPVVSTLTHRRRRNMNVMFCFVFVPSISRRDVPCVGQSRLSCSRSRSSHMAKLAQREVVDFPVKIVPPLKTIAP